MSGRPAAVVFDLYGTLLSIETMRAHVARAGVDDAAAFVAAWRHKQLEYAFLTSLAGAYRDFDELTAKALDHTCAQRNALLDPSQRATLAGAWATMPAFDDVAPALRALHARDIPLAVLTNGTPRSADAALRHAGVRELLAAVLSVDAVHAYKPDQRVYALVSARFGCAPGDVVFVSSNGWDAWGAARFGFRVAWCNRAGNAAETLVPPPEATLAGLHELESFVARDGGYDPGPGFRGEVQLRMDERTNAGNGGTAAEPGLTQKNSATVIGEDILAGGAAVPVVETSTHTRRGAVPSSYGAHGGVAPQADEGSGEDGDED